MHLVVPPEPDNETYVSTTLGIASAWDHSGDDDTLQNKIQGTIFLVQVVFKKRLFVFDFAV